MSYAKIWIHAVWGTKDRERILSGEVRKVLFRHIKENAREKRIFIDNLGGYLEHAHCLFTMNADTSLSKTMQFIKGESAFWVNNQKFLKSKFEWADEYFAVSVSESMVDKISNYIKNQEEHHKKISFVEEYN